MTLYQILAVDLAVNFNATHYHIEYVFCSWRDAFTQLQVQGWLARQYVAEQIDAGTAQAFTHVGGVVAEVLVEHYPNGLKYLRTIPDATGKDNLLNLRRR
jgi:hypothetical protein